MNDHCVQDGCDKPPFRRGNCCAHYKRLLRERGKPDPVRWLDAQPLIDLIEARPDPVDPTSRRAIERARKTGRITETAADRLALRLLGLQLELIYDVEVMS